MTETDRLNENDWITAAILEGLAAIEKNELIDFDIVKKMWREKLSP